mmetsp:Transcript_10006/g.23864  ORF Transcript_10006/g.23864 Transcript_10006/m.23864 type:complete len:229 (-) Transcript_10006:201-887(-)
MWTKIVPRVLCWLQGFSSLPIDTDKLNIEQERLVHHPLIFKNKPEGPSPRERRWLRLLSIHVVVWVSQLHRDDYTTDTADLHAPDSLLERGDDLSLADPEPEEVLVIARERSAFALVPGLKRAPVVADGVPVPVHGHAVPRPDGLALAEPHLLVLQSRFCEREVFKPHAGLSVVLALEGLHGLVSLRGASLLCPQQRQEGGRRNETPKGSPPFSLDVTFDSAFASKFT